MCYEVWYWYLKTSVIDARDGSSFVHIILFIIIQVYFRNLVIQQIYTECLFVPDTIH